MVMTKATTAPSSMISLLVSSGSGFRYNKTPTELSRRIIFYINCQIENHPYIGMLSSTVCTSCLAGQYTSNEGL